MYKNRNDVVYLITDRRGISEDQFFSRIQEAIDAGVELLQLREKDATTREMIALGGRLRAMTRGTKTALIIDDRVDVALAVDADGVHVGADDMPVATVRKLLGPDKIVGATAKTVEQALAAQNDGADYVGTGAIFDTPTHDNPVRTTVETLADVAKATDIGVFAIGGLTADNVHAIQGSGANGACVVRFLMQSDDVIGDVERLRSVLREEV